MTRRRGRWIAAGLLFFLPLGLMYAPGLPHGKYELIVDMQAGDATAVGCARNRVQTDEFAFHLCAANVQHRRIYGFIMQDNLSVVVNKRNDSLRRRRKQTGPSGRA